MSPRTSWSAPETEGVKAYRRRRRAAGVDTDTSVDRGQEGLSESLVMPHLSTAKSPAEQTRMQEHRFKDTSAEERALRRRKLNLKGSGEANFTRNAALALMKRKKRGD